MPLVNLGAFLSATDRECSFELEVRHLIACQGLCTRCSVVQFPKRFDLFPWEVLTHFLSLYNRSVSIKFQWHQNLTLCFCAASSVYWSLVSFPHLLRNWSLHCFPSRYDLKKNGNVHPLIFSNAPAYFSFNAYAASAFDFGSLPYFLLFISHFLFSQIHAEFKNPWKSILH